MRIRPAVILTVLALAGIAQALSPYRVVVKWPDSATIDERRMAITNSFKQELQQGGPSHLMIVANEEEVAEIVRQWRLQIGDPYGETKVEMGNLVGGEFVAELNLYKKGGGEALSVGLWDLAKGANALQQEATLSENDPGAAGIQLGYAVRCALPPRALVVGKSDGERVTLERMESSAVPQGQMIVLERNGERLAEGKVNWATDDGVETQFTWGWERIGIGDTLHLHMPPVPIARGAPLTVLIEPPTTQADVWIDGRRVGKTTNGRLEVAVWPGLHQVTIRGGDHKQRQVDVPRGGTTVRFGLEGLLAVQSSVPGMVRTRGEQETSWTPLGKTHQYHSVPAGHYRVRVSAPGHLVYEGDAFVRPGRQTEVVARLAQATGMAKVSERQVALGAGSEPLNPPRTAHLDPFYMDVREVTVAEFKQVFPYYEPSFSDYPDSAPAVGVDWYQARDYCREQKKRLPSQDEWECACRGKQGHAFGYGPRYDAAKTDARAPGAQIAKHPVRWPSANSFGLYDMTGGVWEWCADPGAGGGNVVRGGAWIMREPETSSSCAHAHAPDPSQSTAKAPIGFRCAADAE